MSMVRAIARQWMACVVVVLSWPCLAAAGQPPTPVPSADILSILQNSAVPAADRLSRQLREGSAEARDCSFVDGRHTCRCVRRASSETTVHVDTLRDGGSATGLWIEQGEETLFVAELTPSDHGVVFDRLAWTNGEIVLLAAGGLAAGDVQLNEVRWYRDTLGRPACDRAPNAANGRSYARADAVSRVAGHWRVASLKIGPWPVGDGPLQRPTSGVLPPTARAADAGAELQGDYWLAPWGSVLAAVDPSGRFGAGVGITSRRRDTRRRLDLVGYGSIEDGLVPVGSGDLSVGERLHLRAHVEHPSDEHAGSLRAYERGSLYRPWRVSRVGLSLSGDGHALQLRGAVLTDPETSDARWNGNLAYGTTFARQRHSVWRMDLEHRSVDETDTLHSTVAAVGWRGPFGRTSRAWFTPGADVVANYSAVTARRGFDASTTVSTLASVDAGLAVEGRFQRLSHRIGPRLRAGAEFLGVQQRQPEEGAPPYPWRQPDRWRWALAMLDQSVRQGHWRLELPIGVFADAIGDDSLADGLARPHGLARLNARYDDVSVGVATTCSFPCDTPRFHAVAHIAPGRRLRAWYAAGNMGVRELAVAWADLHLDQPITALRLVQTRDASAASEVFAHHAGVRLSRGRATLGLHGNWGPTDASRGVGGDVGVHWPELGWGLGVGGGWRPFDAAWNVVGGLSWSR